MDRGDESEFGYAALLVVQNELCGSTTRASKALQMHDEKIAREKGAGNAPVAVQAVKWKSFQAFVEVLAWSLGKRPK